MKKHVLISKSISEARRSFARLVRDVEDGSRVGITRHGKRVAVLLSAADFDALAPHRPSPWEAIRAIRERIVREHVDMGTDPFEDVRDQSPLNGSTARR